MCIWESNSPPPPPTSLSLHLSDIFQFAFAFFLSYFLFYHHLQKKRNWRNSLLLCFFVRLLVEHDPSLDFEWEYKRGKVKIGLLRYCYCYYYISCKKRKKRKTREKISQKQETSQLSKLQRESHSHKDKMIKNLTMGNFTDWLTQVHEIGTPLLPAIYFNFCYYKSILLPRHVLSVCNLITLMVTARPEQ